MRGETASGERKQPRSLPLLLPRVARKDPGQAAAEEEEEEGDGAVGKGERTFPKTFRFFPSFLSLSSEERVKKNELSLDKTLLLSLLSRPLRRAAGAIKKSHAALPRRGFPGPAPPPLRIARSRARRRSRYENESARLIGRRKVDIGGATELALLSLPSRGGGGVASRLLSPWTTGGKRRPLGRPFLSPPPPVLGDLPASPSCLTTIKRAIKKARNKTKQTATSTRWTPRRPPRPASPAARSSRPRR